MKIGREEVIRIARLAHIRFSEEELERLRGQLDQILSYVDKLNELECTDDAIYANIWGRSEIHEIEPDSGAVVAIIDASELSGRVTSVRSDPEAVLNGIAIEPGTGRTFLTGKYWPTLFEVRFEPSPEPR